MLNRFFSESLVIVLQKFLSNYINPSSPTFGDAFHSALKAGYKANYANIILCQMPVWLNDKLKRSTMLMKAERNLDKILDMETREPILAAFGLVKDKDGNIILKENPNLLRTKADVSKFVAEKIGRAVYGSEEPIPTSVTNNLTQIIINAPNRQQTGNKSDRETIPSVASSSESQDS